MSEDVSLQAENDALRQERDALFRMVQNVPKICVSEHGTFSRCVGCGIDLYAPIKKEHTPDCFIKPILDVTGFKHCAYPSVNVAPRSPMSAEREQQAKAWRAVKALADTSEVSLHGGVFNYIENERGDRWVGHNLHESVLNAADDILGHDWDKGAAS